MNLEKHLNFARASSLNVHITRDEVVKLLLRAIREMRLRATHVCRGLFPSLCCLLKRFASVLETESGKKIIKAGNSGLALAIRKGRVVH